MPAASLPTREQIDQVLHRLSEISGFPVRHHLRFESITRPELARYLDARTQEAITSEELEHQQAALEFLGFVPRGFDLRKLTIDLMTEQAAAFYDYRKKSLFLSDWVPGSMRDTAVIHEIAHALADQNFHLGRYAGKVEGSSEKSAARQAVVEGQASYLMFAYAETDTPSTETHPDPASFDDAISKGDGQYPVFDRAPLYMRMSLIFPYTWGLAFQSALVDRLGRDGFTKPFRDPPISTQQILHPDLYFAGMKPQPCKLPKAPRDYRPVFEGDLGELDHRVLLQQLVSLKQAKRVSPAWRGDAFQLLENRRDHRRILLYASEWSDEKSAATFLWLYRKCMEAKSTNIHIAEKSDLEFSGQNDWGYFQVKRTGTRIDSIEGSPAPP